MCGAYMRLQSKWKILPLQTVHIRTLNYFSRGGQLTLPLGIQPEVVSVGGKQMHCVSRQKVKSKVYKKSIFAEEKVFYGKITGKTEHANGTFNAINSSAGANLQQMLSPGVDPNFRRGNLIGNMTE